MTLLVHITFNRGYVVRKVCEYFANFNTNITMKFTRAGLTISKSSDSTNGVIHNEVEFKSQYMIKYKFNDSTTVDVDNNEYHSISLMSSRLKDILGQVKKKDSLSMELKLDEEDRMYIDMVDSLALYACESEGEEVNEFTFTKQDHEAFVTMGTEHIGTLTGKIKRFHEGAAFIIYPDALEIKIAGRDALASRKAGNPESIRKGNAIDYYVISYKFMKALGLYKNMSENGCVAFYYESGQPLRMKAILNCIGSITTIITNNDELDVDSVLPQHLIKERELREANEEHESDSESESGTSPADEDGLSVMNLVR